MTGHDYQGANTAMMISREEMDAHVAAGRAHPWTQPIGPDQLVYLAARMDDTWYYLPPGDDNYRPAPEELAAVLTRGEAALAVADQKIAQADAARVPRDEHSAGVDTDRST